MSFDQETIKTMEDAGIGFIGQYRAPGGSQTVRIEGALIKLYLENRDEFAARTLGVSEEDYRRWVECDGTPTCGARTVSGHRCKNWVSGGIQRTMGEWLALDGGLCAVHGGESADEARVQRFSSGSEPCA